ncbi:MAG: hypothetical protein SchgKO_10950 [Schleiferiaceae bacterium]
MKKSLIPILLVVFTFAHTFASGQCTECESLEEALKDPQRVKSLIVNPFLGGAEMDTILPDIGQLKNLETLFLTDQSFTTIPPEIGQLKNLKEISFSGSPISELPEEFFEIKSPAEIILFNTAMTDEYQEAFKKKALERWPDVKVLID